MADKTQKTPKNVAGKFYVDKTCICCGQCVATAPKFFAEDTAIGMMYVKEQPKDETSNSLCKDALANCPVEAIGDDGE